MLAARATFVDCNETQEETRRRLRDGVEEQLREKLRAQAAEIAETRLPFADDLAPAARLGFFAAYVDKLVAAGEVAKLRAALPDLLAEERPAEETTEFYRQRRQEIKQVVVEGYAPRRVLVSGFLDGKLADAEDLAPVERFEAFQDYVGALELLDDGPLAWDLNQTWTTTVLLFLRDFADRIDVDFAMQLRKDVLARFPDSEKESNRELLAWTAKELRDGGFIGSAPTVKGRLASNGEPLDWNSYRGAPVLVEIFRWNPEQAFPWQSNLAFESDAFFKGCVDAGLQVIRYGAGSYENARLHYEATRPNQPEYFNAIYVDRDSPVVGPREGGEGASDWALRLGVARFGRAWILFDADGRVVTTCPKPAGLRVYRNAPTLQEALEALYPNVPVK